MEIKNRGVPPYTISNGPPEIRSSGTREQIDTADTFQVAILIINSLTDGGCVNYGQYISDSEGNIVFDVSAPKDQKLLEDYDKIARHATLDGPPAIVFIDP